LINIADHAATARSYLQALLVLLLLLVVVLVLVLLVLVVAAAGRCVV